MWNSRVILFLIIARFPTVFSQENIPHLLNMGVAIGVTNITLTDQAFNYYNYSGKSLYNMVLDGFYQKNQNQFELNLAYTYSIIKPTNAKSYLYSYNYINMNYITLEVDYFRALYRKKSRFQFYGGISNNSNVFFENLQYNNLLYETGGDRLTIYHSSVLDVFGTIKAEFNLGKSSFRFKTGYSLLNLHVIPDDNYVKLSGIYDSPTWKFSSIKKHTGISAAVLYLYKWNEKLRISGEFKINYEEFTDNLPYKYLVTNFLIGINRTF